jgi:riboflavin synthase
VFTGIIEELGHVMDVLPVEGGTRLRISAPGVLEDLRVGDSIAHDGVCLTVTSIEASCYCVELVAETLARSTLGDLRAGDVVNIERPLRMADRLGGHLVQGHVDAVGTISSRAPDGDGLHLRIRVPEGVLRYAVEKGSIAVDGISLTVTRVDEEILEVAIIPHTAKMTTLGRKEPGSRVNIEVDVIAKYLEKLARHLADATEKS